MLKKTMYSLKRFLIISMHLHSAHKIIPVLGLFALLNAPVAVAAVESVTGQDDSGMLSTLLITMTVALALAALIIIGLIFWGRKQDHIQEMMFFCLKYLINSEDQTIRRSSARALGQTKNVDALLVLFDVTLEEDEAEAVRKTASEALQDMSVHFHEYQKVITDLVSEAEQRNFLSIIDLLITNFEQGKTKYTQSAFIIGRYYMELSLYADAREWMFKAESRNQKFNLYGNRIRNRIKICNTRLLEEADDSFAAADYQQAREHYSVLDHGLSDTQRRRCALYLRSACVDCKLQDYRNADRSLLQALEHNHEKDLALTLAPMLQEILDQGDKKVKSDGELEETRSAIDERASEIMSTLLAQESP